MGAAMPGWTSLLLGLFLVALALYELRRPGGWHRMIEEIETSAALSMLTGLLEMALGAVVYLGDRGAPEGDFLARVMMVLGGLMIVEALAVIAVPDLYIRFWMRKMGERTRGWALFAVALGAAFAGVGLARLV